MKEQAKELIGADTLERLAKERGITPEEVELLAQTYFDAKSTAEICGGGQQLQFEDFLPRVPVPPDTPDGEDPYNKSEAYDAAERFLETALVDKKRRDAMRAMHDAVRVKMGMPAIKWTH